MKTAVLGRPTAIPALLLIDIQAGFRSASWGTRNNAAFEARAARLLEAWRAHGGAVFHVRHHSTETGSPLRPDRPGARFMDFARPARGETVVTKRVNSAFIGTDLEARLRARGHAALVLAGLTTDHCVSTSARMAANLGFHVAVADDATATFDRRGPRGGRYPAELVHRLALASLRDEFARVVGTAALIAELGTCAS